MCGGLLGRTRFDRQYGHAALVNYSAVDGGSRDNRQVADASQKIGPIRIGIGPDPPKELCKL